MPAKNNQARQQILEAAAERFRHYGYSKTTMSEVAADCGMSAGNIYRFFTSKLDLAEAWARLMSAETWQDMAEITRRSDPAADRLRAMFQYTLENTYAKLNQDAKILELAEVLSAERPGFANQELAQERVYMRQILDDGVASGEFAPMPDMQFTAEMIQSAMMKFRYPQLWSRLDLDQLRREMNGVFDLIMDGVLA